MSAALRVIFGVPRYKTIGPEAEDFTVECVAEFSAAGHAFMRPKARQLSHLWCDVAREMLCQWGIENRCDVVLMSDSDCRISAEDAVRLAEECVRGGWAMLTAPVPIRNEGTVNWCAWPEDRAGAPTRADLQRQSDARRARGPLSIEGFAGTGVCAVNLAILATMERPWWHREIELDKIGHARPAGTDVWFCRRALRQGKRIGVHLGIESGEHYGEAVWTGKDALAAMDADLAARLAKAAG